MAWLILAGGGCLQAQTNALPAPARTQTRIDSESAVFDLTSRHAIYRGNVRVDDPKIKLSCEELTADLPQSGGHVDHLVALTNVVMDSVDDKGQTTHATSDKAIYDYKVVNGVTNEPITLTGNAKVENAQVILTGEPIIYNRATGSLTATNQHMIFKQNLASALASTNLPVENLPVEKTNFPPVATPGVDKSSINQAPP